MRRSLFLAVLVAVVWLAAGCGQGTGGASPGPDEVSSSSASRDRRVLGVRGLPPGWDEATRADRPKRSPGVRVEGPVLSGTEGDDLIVAGRGAQTVRGMGGGDALSGGAGRDRIYGGPGDDLINAQGDGAKDEIDCGPGRDEVRWDGEYEKRPRRCEFQVIGME